MGKRIAKNKCGNCFKRVYMCAEIDADVANMHLYLVLFTHKLYSVHFPDAAVAAG